MIVNRWLSYDTVIRKVIISVFAYYGWRHTHRHAHEGAQKSAPSTRDSALCERSGKYFYEFSYAVH